MNAGAASPRRLRLRTIGREADGVGLAGRHGGLALALAWPDRGGSAEGSGEAAEKGVAGKPLRGCNMAGAGDWAPGRGGGSWKEPNGSTVRAWQLRHRESALGYARQLQEWLNGTTVATLTPRICVRVRSPDSRMAERYQRGDFDTENLR